MYVAHRLFRDGFACFRLLPDTTFFISCAPCWAAFSRSSTARHSEYPATCPLQGRGVSPVPRERCGTRLCSERSSHILSVHPAFEAASQQFSPRRTNYSQVYKSTAIPRPRLASACPAPRGNWGSLPSQGLFFFFHLWVPGYIPDLSVFRGASRRVCGKDEVADTPCKELSPSTPHIPSYLGKSPGRYAVVAERQCLCILHTLLGTCPPACLCLPELSMPSKLCSQN